MYTKEEFARSVKLRGYPSRKSQINAFFAECPKEYYDENDFQEYYHFASVEYLRAGRNPGKCSDGQNYNSASNMPNSSRDVLGEINLNYYLSEKAESKWRAQYGD